MAKPTTRKELIDYSLRQLGARVLEINVGDDVKKEFGLIRHNFNPNLSGDAKFQFRIISGKWNISDISVVPSTDTGFSPSFVRFQQELPPELVHKRPETLEFLTEFYDMNNNEVEIPERAMSQAYSEIDQAIYDWEIMGEI